MMVHLTRALLLEDTAIQEPKRVTEVPVDKARSVTNDTRGTNMMRAIGLLALLAVLDVGAASAQMMDAPTGHRQPRASDVPDEKN